MREYEWLRLDQIDRIRIECKKCYGAIEFLPGICDRVLICPDCGHEFNPESQEMYVLKLIQEAVVLTLRSKVDDPIGSGTYRDANLGVYLYVGSSEEARDPENEGIRV